MSLKRRTAAPRRSLVRSNLRAGEANSFYVLMLGGMAVLAVLGVMLWKMGQPAAQGNSASQGLMLYCAADLRQALEEVAADYKREQGVEVQMQFAGSGALLNQIEIAKTGDLFLAADDSYVELARDKNLVDEAIPLATMVPVLAVQRGNPKNIKGLKDLLRDDVVTVLGNPDQAAIGRISRDLLRKAGLWAGVEKQVTERGSFQPTVPFVANVVDLGKADAAILWNTTVKRYPKLEAIHTPELDAGLAHITLAVLKSSEQPTSALRFARYLSARDKGLTNLAKHGYDVVEGDDWAETPNLIFYIGSVNRRAVEATIEAFQRREGVEVTTVYNGCGILTAQMREILAGRKKIGFPDVYLACDVYYLNTVKELFQDAAEVSETEVVIAVPKGNPLNVKSLKDLTLPGIRVTVGQCEQCTIGVLTRQLLETEELLSDVQKNVVTETATSAMLVPTVTTKAADATLAYATDTKAEADKLDVIHIPSPAAKAVQPFAIARSSQHKNLARRLFQAIARSRDQFEAAGFQWRLDKAKSPPADSGKSTTAVAPRDGEKQEPAAPSQP